MATEWTSRDGRVVGVRSARAAGQGTRWTWWMHPVVACTQVVEVVSESGEVRDVREVVAECSEQVRAWDQQQPTVEEYVAARWPEERQ